MVVGFLADKLPNPTSVSLCPVKTTNFKVLSNSLTMQIGCSKPGVNVTVPVILSDKQVGTVSFMPVKVLPVK